MALQESVKDGLIVTTFVFIVVDRLLLLAALRFKAIRILMKSANGVAFERWLLQFFTKEVGTIVTTILLTCFLILGLMGILSRESISNEVGRVVFGAIALALSVFGTLLNGCMERIDLRSQLR